jgi:hypothetical protein
MSVFEDKVGIDESLEKARDWIKKNAFVAGASAPLVSEGAAILHLK